MACFSEICCIHGGVAWRRRRRLKVCLLAHKNEQCTRVACRKHRHRRIVCHFWLHVSVCVSGLQNIYLAIKLFDRLPRIFYICCSAARSEESSHQIYIIQTYAYVYIRTIEHIIIVDHIGGILNIGMYIANMEIAVLETFQKKFLIKRKVFLFLFSVAL